MKTPGQRGAFGSWLTTERTRRYPTQHEALADMRRLAGLRISESEFAQWESGSRVPREDNPKVARLYEFFGSKPSDFQLVPAVTDPDSVAAAIREQTAALVALLEAANRRAYVAEQRLDAIETVLLNMTNRPGVDPRDVAEADAVRLRLAGSESSPPQRRLTDAGRAQQ